MTADVVLLPGLHGSTALFEEFVALAPPWARCRPLALPASGDQSFDGLARALAPAVFSDDGPRVLIAESFSTPIAARLSALANGRVALLVLCNPLFAVPLRMPKRLAAWFTRSALCPARLVAFAMAGGDMTLGAAVASEIRALPRVVLERRLSSAFGVRERDIVNHAAARLLVITGARDRLIAPRTARRIVLTLSDASLVELPAAHLVIQATPGALWNAITKDWNAGEDQRRPSNSDGFQRPSKP